MKRYLIGGAALLILSACATKPDLAEDVAQVEQAVTPPPQAPQIFEPAPLPPAVERIPEAVAVAPQIDLWV